MNTDSIFVGERAAVEWLVKIPVADFLEMVSRPRGEDDEVNLFGFPVVMDPAIKGPDLKFGRLEDIGPLGVIKGDENVR